MSRSMPLLFAAALVLVADPALAFRCQGKIVSEGDPQAKVLKFCGEPTSVQQRMIYRGGLPRSRVSRELSMATDTGSISTTRQELLIHDRSVVEVVVEEWTYNLGPHQLMRVVRFEDGLVADVRKLGYGYLE